MATAKSGSMTMEDRNMTHQPDWQRASIEYHRRNGTLAQPPAARGAAYDAATGLPGSRTAPPNGFDRRRPARDQAFERRDDLGTAPSDLTGETDDDDELSAVNLYRLMVVARARLSPQECQRFDQMLASGPDAAYSDIDAIAASGPPA